MYKGQKNLLFMIFFPIFLVILIGSVLTSIFEQENDKFTTEETYIYYLAEDSSKTKEILEIFIDALESEETSNLILKEVESLEEGKTKVQVNKEILLHFKDDTINVYSNDEELIKSSYIYGLLNGISNRLNSTMEVYKINLKKLGDY